MNTLAELKFGFTDHLSRVASTSILSFNQITDEQINKEDTRVLKAFDKLVEKEKSKDSDIIWFSISQIARQSKIEKSSLSRILGHLQGYRYIKKDGVKQYVKVGMELIRRLGEFTCPISGKLVRAYQKV